MVDKLFRTTLFWAALVFVLVEGALLFVIFKFRGKPDDPEPEQIHGNTMVEVIWTVIPALILALIAVPTVRTIFRTYEMPKGADVLQVEVIGHQWWWEFRYPQLGLTTAERAARAGRAARSSLKMVTQDVLHSFWIPQLAAKRDVFRQPHHDALVHGRGGRATIRASAPSSAASSTAGWPSRSWRRRPTEFDAYVSRHEGDGGAAGCRRVRRQRGEAERRRGRGRSPTATMAASTPARPRPTRCPGSQLFMMKGCIGCHSLNATKPMGIGPNLAGIGTRLYIAAGWLENTDANLAHWIQHPQQVKTGRPDARSAASRTAEAQALVAYLRQH